MKLKLLLQVMIMSFCTHIITAQTPNEQIAKNWIEKNTEKLDIQPHHDLKLLFSRKGSTGETLRYYQMINDVQVYDAEITIHISPRGEVNYYQSTYNKDVPVINTVPNISKNDALQRAIAHLKIAGYISFKSAKLFVYNKLSETKLVYKVNTQSEFLTGYWETIVDAHTGQILSAKDVAMYTKSENDLMKISYSSSATQKRNAIAQKTISQNNTTSASATGTALVFAPDPLDPGQNTYSGNYVDNNDLTNSQLDAARVSVSLPDIDFSGGQYRLDGTYVRIASLQSPNTGLFNQATNSYNFDRNQQGFEAVNAYYQIDNSMRYINNTLGISVSSIYSDGVIRFDPHSLNGIDNSTYGGGMINFGEGGVDDAEDADVILHELGHGIHDWITNGSLSQVDGLSEGMADYWAQSYKRSLGNRTSADPYFHYVFGWDGHNPFWPGRVTNYPNLYPGGLVGQIHTDGQIFGTTMMEIWDIIGKTKTDAALLEGIAMTNSSTSQPNAAIAIRQAAIDMVINNNQYGMTCADVDVMTARFNARGYNIPVINCTTLNIDEFAMEDNVSIYPNPTNNDLKFKNLKQSYKVEIYNLIGQKVISTTVDETKNHIDVSALSQGTYLIKLNDINGALKFIKL